MKPTPFNYNNCRSLLALGSLLFGLVVSVAPAQTIQWGLTLTNINNPTAAIVVTNLDGSLSITAGGGDTYDPPDSFTYAYQQVTGDFDIRVRVMNVVGTDLAEGSQKGALMVRTSLDSLSYNFQINALPAAPFPRNGQIESIGRIVQPNTDDLPGRMQQFGGDTTADNYATYPDVWLRVQRQGNMLRSYFASTNTTDFPSGWASNPGSTNGWQLIAVSMTGTNFPKTLYVGLSTVAHNPTPAGAARVTATYASYGPVPTPPSIPSANGVAVAPGNAPGVFPNKKVLAANIDASVAADGLGYPPDIVQSNQGAPQQIIWNSGGFGTVSRDIIASIPSQTPGAFTFARYQAGAFDFVLNPRDPVAAVQHLGPYSNPQRVRYGTGGTNVPASQAWVPSPNYGFVFTTVRKNGQQWNDTSPFFYAASYVQLDGVATAQAYDMISGHFRGAQFYTRTTKLVTGTPTNPSSDLSNLQRCAVPIAIAWFPYDQGWKAGFFDPPELDPNPGTPHWKRGDGWGLNSGAAVVGLPLLAGQRYYNSPTNLLTWVDTTGGLTFSGLATLNLPSVSSTNDGMLFTIGNGENNSKRGPSVNNAALLDGAGWYVAVRDIEESKTDPTIYASGGSGCDASFSFVYIPYNSDNLIGGQIRPNGTVAKSAGNFSVSRLSTGRYAVTIPGKTGTNGVVLLQTTGYLATQPAGMSNVVDTSTLSYEYGGTNTPNNAFIIESRYIDTTGGGEGVVTLRDAGFYFAYVDFQNPLGPPGTLPPVLSIVRSGANVIVSWSNGPGFMLQRATALTTNTSWVTLGAQNPQTIPITSGNQFFRVVSP
jgi:hypothetical protein